MQHYIHFACSTASLVHVRIQYPVDKFWILRIGPVSFANQQAWVDGCNYSILIHFRKQIHVYSYM